LVFAVNTAWFLLSTQLGFACSMLFFKSISPLASFFLLLRQKKETKEKATPGSLESPQ
jgi:hypothetical protein